MVVLVYLHGRLWRGPGVGLVAAVLTGFNRDLLVQMQQATPTTLGLAGTLAVLLCYGGHLRVAGERLVVAALGLGRAGLLGGPGGPGAGADADGGRPVRPGRRAGGPAAPGVPPRRRRRRAERDGRAAAGWLALAGQPEPGGRGAWRWRSGAGAGGPLARLDVRAATGRAPSGALLAPVRPARRRTGPGLLARLVDLAPATLPLGLFAAVRTIRLALTDEDDDRAIVGGVVLGALAGRRGPGAGVLAERPAAAARACSCSSR